MSRKRKRTDSATKQNADAAQNSTKNRRGRKYVIAIASLLVLGVLGTVLSSRSLGESWLGHGDQALEARRLDLADSFYQKAHKYSSFSMTSVPATATLRRARIARLAGDETKMADLLQQARDQGAGENLVKREEMLHKIQNGSAGAFTSQMTRLLAADESDTAAVFEAYATGLTAEGDFASANTVVDQWLQFQPESARALLHKGRYALQNGQLADAKSLLTLSVKQNEHIAESRSWLAQTCYAQKNTDSALKHFDAATKLDPSDMSAALGKANVLLETRRFDDAVSEFERVLKMAPENFPARFMLASHYSRNEKPRRAIELIEPTLTNYGDDVAINYLLANAYSQIGQTDQSEMHLEKYFVARKAIDRFDSLRATANTNTNDFQLRKELGLGYLKYEWDSAEPWLAEALRLQPRDAEIHRGLADAYKKLGDRELAKRFEESARLLER